MNLIKDKHNGEPKIWWHNGGADEAIDARIEDGDGLIFTEENELKIAMFDAATSSWIGNGAATEIEKPDDPLVVGEYFVKFYVNKELYETVKTLGGHTINEPEEPEAPEGYTFKNWLLNGEAFDFSTTITSDILLIAEFEEAPQPSSYTWNGTDVSEKDITSRESETPYYYHHIADVTSITATDLLGATLVITLNGIETSYVLTEENVESQQAYGGTQTVVTVDETQNAVVITVGLSSFGFADGIYFLRYDEEGKTHYGEYTSSLTLAE